MTANKKKLNFDTYISIINILNDEGDIKLLKFNPELLKNDTSDDAFYNSIENISLKDSLLKLILECKKQSELSEYDFLIWLNKKEKTLISKIQSMLKPYIKANYNNDNEKKNLENDNIEWKPFSWDEFNFYSAHWKMVERIIYDFKNELLNEGVIESPAKIKQPNLSYNWLSSPDTELLNLYDKMKGNFISDDTPLEQFTAVFTGQLIESITPIKWHNKYASEVLYFIVRLEEARCIETKTDKNDIVKTDYEKLKRCFIKSDGNLFEENFKELKQNIQITLKKEKREGIDKIIADFT